MKFSINKQKTIEIIGEYINILKDNGKNAIYLDTNEKIKEYIKKEAKQGDIKITIGAGDVTKIGDIIKD